VAAFQSTLTEAREATLLLHVIDASDPRRDERIDQVNGVLDEIGAGELPQIRVFNKIDRLGDAPHLERDAQGLPAAVWVSAATRAGIPLLLQAVAERLSRFARPVRLRIQPGQAGALRARLFAAGVVRDERTAADGTLELVANLPETRKLELARTAGVEVSELPASVQPCAPDDGYLQSPVVLRAS
jgi:GTP-binding protein HflX